VVLTEGGREFGGRARLESGLPGLSEWRRVVDWRLTQIDKLTNVSLYPGSPMTAADILEAGIPHVIVATGARWRRDGLGRSHWQPIPGHDLSTVLTPDDLMAGVTVSGRLAVFDDDHYYMGSVLAELLVDMGCQVDLLTPAPLVAHWAYYTLERDRTQQRLLRLGVALHPHQTLAAIQPAAALLLDAVTGRESRLPCDHLLLVTDRISQDQLYYDLKPALADGRLQSLRVIGDAEAPHLIAQAVYSGHLAAREFGEPPAEGTPFRREYACVGR